MFIREAGEKEKESAFPAHFLYFDYFMIFMIIAIFNFFVINEFKVDRLQIILVAKNIYLRVATVHQ